MSKNAKVSLRKWYKTRDGSPVNLWCLDPKARMKLPVKGHVLTKTDKGKTSIQNGTWTRLGKWPHSTNANHPWDLVEITEDKWRYLTSHLRLV